jgi:heterogeneous nuclear ribonucleoprotein F/H
MPVIKLRGLPWSCTAEDVANFLSGIKIVPKEYSQEPFTNPNDLSIYLTTNQEGRPSGEAFIKVFDENDLQVAAQKNDQMMGQRYIEVFLSNEEQLEKHLNESSDNKSNWRDPVVRLRGLPYNCTKQDIVNFFDGNYCFFF